jgi:GTP cyclohydrolase II
VYLEGLYILVYEETGAEYASLWQSRNFSAGARILKKFAIFSKSRLTSITFPRTIAHVERLTLRNAIEYWGFA